MARTGRAGLLIAALLVLVGVAQPTGDARFVPPHGLAVTAPVSVGHAWQDTPHTFQDQPRRLAPARPAPPIAADTSWAVYEPATTGGPPHGRARAGDHGDFHRGCAAPPPRSSRAPPADVS